MTAAAGKQWLLDPELRRYICRAWPQLPNWEVCIGLEQQPTEDTRPARSRWWYLLLVLPYVGLLWVPIYATDEPELWGFPFFYWYQFAWVPVTALLIWIVYRKVR